jgi:hypothetical protein
LDSISCTTSCTALATLYIYLWHSCDSTTLRLLSYCTAAAYSHIVLIFMFATAPFVTALFVTVTELGSAQQTGGNPFASPPHNDAAYMAAAAAAAAASGSRLPSSSSGGSTPHISGLEALDASVSRSGGTSSGPSSTKSRRSGRTANRTVKQERTLAQLLAHTG